MTNPNHIEVELGPDPMIAGADVALQLTPVLLDAMRQADYSTPDQQLCFWSGLFSSLSGTLCAQLGPVAAKSILQYLIENPIARMEANASKEAVH